MLCLCENVPQAADLNRIDVQQSRGMIRCGRCFITMQCTCVAGDLNRKYGGSIVRLGEYRLPVTLTVPAFEGSGSESCVDSHNAPAEILR